MKSLLSILAVSTLVGTSGSSLQPMFAQKIVNTGFKSKQVNNKNISIKNQNNTNPFINKIPTIDDNSNISSNVISSNGTIYLGTYNKGLWKSTDGIKFIKTSFSGKYTSSITIYSYGVNQNLSAINTAYENAIKNVESGLNLHRYSISEILNGKQKPQTKSEIANFADGKSYRDWLQTQANIKFHGWQLKIGLPIGLISLVIVVVAGCFIYRRTNPKYHGYWRVKKEAKLRKSNFKKMILIKIIKVIKYDWKRTKNRRSFDKACLR